MSNKYSCIISAYNEGLRLIEVLKPVSEVEEINQIICCVDGDKNEKAIEVIKNQFPKVIVDASIAKRGKTGAVLSGLAQTKNENLFLLDADLIGLKIEDIKKAIKVYEDNNLDCLLLHTKPMNFYYAFWRKLFRVSICVNGNRITKKELVLNALKDKKANGYQLEVAQNRYLMVNNKKAAYFAISTIDLGKVAKEGFISGTIKELGMWQQLVTYDGWKFFLKQAFSFAKKELQK